MEQKIATLVKNNKGLDQVLRSIVNITDLFETNSKN